MPQNPGYLSCSLVLGAATACAREHDADGFLAPADLTATVQALLDPASDHRSAMAVALVQLDGLESALRGTPEANASSIRHEVSSALRLDSLGGAGGAQVGEEKFAVLCPPGQALDGLLQRLRAVCGDKVQASGVQLGLDGASPEQDLRALRFALDRFIELDPRAVAIGFDEMVASTTAETSRFRTMLATSSFRLVYQPVVSLADGELHHFEALARLSGDDSPEKALRLAEEVGLIVDFDLAVAKLAAAALTRAAPSLRVAVNLSAVSLLRPSALEEVLAIAKGRPNLSRRLLIEITETRRIGDLVQANQAIAALRRQGHQVCIDDFGAGAATLDYIRQLEVDFVKIDGRYVRHLDSQPRDATIVKHVARLCCDLGIQTIAEMVETEAAAAVLRSLDVPLAQGWRFGRPTEELVWRSTALAAAPARRRGAVEQWG